MSFSAVATYTTDKSADMFGQSGFEELGNDFFDQFIDFSPVEDTTPEYLLPDTYLERSISDQSGDLSLNSTDDEAKHGSHNTWRGEPWANNSAASLVIPGSQHFYNELTGRAAISDSELLSLEDIYLESPVVPAFCPISLPPSPSPNATVATRRKNRVVESLSKSLKKATASLDKRFRTPIRKSSSSPKMMRAHSNKSSRDLQLENFDFDLQANILPLSPPPSARAPAFQESDMMTPVKGEPLNGFAYHNGSNQQVNGTDLYTPLSTPILETPSTRSINQQTPVDANLCPITPQTQSAAPTWTQLPNSQDFANIDTNTMYPISDLESPLWYGHANTTPIAQPSPSSFHTNPQRATKSLAMQLQNDLAFSSNDLTLDPMNQTGLGIQIPIAQQFIMGSPPIMQRGYFASPNQNPQPQRRQPQQGQTQPQHQNQNQHQRQLSNGGNRLPPHNARPRLQHQHSQSYTQNSPVTQSRKPRSRSISPNTPSYSVHKNKTRKTKTASSPTMIDFVNYTPNDSRKILTGVAPSGSSKTKARREREAEEKRRRLSQAAVRAVRAAGGSLEGLGEFIV